MELLTKVFEILNEALGRKPAIKGKLTHLHPMGDTTAPLITEPEEVKQEADNHGTRAHGPRTGAPQAAKNNTARHMARPHKRDTRTWRGAQNAMPWPTFQNALQKCVAKKAVGIDGWNAYLLRRAPTAIQERYWHLLRACVENKKYHTEWRQ